METRKPVAFSYIRFSTPEQSKGDSLRRQTELSARYAEEHGLLLREDLKMHDVGSAFTGAPLAGQIPPPLATPNSPTL